MCAEAIARVQQAQTKRFQSCPFFHVGSAEHLAAYLPYREGAERWFAGISLALLEAAGVVGALLGGSLSDRFGRRMLLFVSMLTTPLLMFVFLAVEGWF